MGLVNSLFKLPGCLAHPTADPEQERNQIQDQEQRKAQRQDDFTSRHDEKMRKIKKRSSKREQEGEISESLENSASETKTECSRGRKKEREGRREMRKRDTDDAEGIKRESTLKPLVMNASAENSASVPVRSKERVKDSEQHMNVLEEKREMKMQTDIKTSPAVHRKSSKESQDASPLSIETLTLSQSPPSIQVAPRTPASAVERVKSHHLLRLEPLVRRVDPHPSTTSPERSKEGRARKRLRKPRKLAENMDHEVLEPLIHVIPQPSTTSPEISEERCSGRKLRKEAENMDHEVLETQIHVIPHPSTTSPERSKEGRARRRLRKPRKLAENMDHEGSSPYVPYDYTEVISLPAALSQSDIILMGIKDDNSESDEPEVEFISPFELMDTRHRRPEPMLREQLMFCWMEENTEMLESESAMDEVQPEAPEQQETPVKKSHPESNTDREQTLQKEKDTHENIIKTHPNGPAGDTQDHLKDQEKTKAARLFVLRHWFEKKTKKQKEKKTRKERTQLKSLWKRYINSPALNHLYINKNNPNYHPILLL